jgi:hypothetical protein
VLQVGIPTPPCFFLDDDVARPPADSRTIRACGLQARPGSFSFSRKEEDVSKRSQSGMDADLTGSLRCERAAAQEVDEGLATTPNGAADLDLLRLACVCRTDALLLGTPERSVALARIHRFFDHAPRGAALGDLLLSALVAPACNARES